MRRSGPFSRKKMPPHEMTTSPIEHSLSKVRPAIFVYRAATAPLRAFRTGNTPTACVRERYGTDPVTNIILQRAAVPPAEVTGTPGWAANLAGVAIYDLVQDAAAYSAGAELI